MLRVGPMVQRSNRTTGCSRSSSAQRSGAGCEGRPGGAPSQRREADVLLEDATKGGLALVPTLDGDLTDSESVVREQLEGPDHAGALQPVGGREGELLVRLFFWL